MKKFGKIQEERLQFELTNSTENSEVLKFEGMGKDYTVYNCSVPVNYNGETYIFGRVEPHNVWANSFINLFQLDKKDGVYKRVNDFNGYGLEDPFIETINGEFVLGGNIVFRNGVPGTETYRVMFYRSKDLKHWYHFTAGPYMMKDIRLVQLPNKKVGVFSRPRSEDIRLKFGSESMVGFTIVNSLEEITTEVIENAPYIENFFRKDEWGGVNQAKYLGGDYIGIIGHQCYNHDFSEFNQDVPAYINTAYVFNMKTRLIEERKIIATRLSFPDTDYKTFGEHDVAFASGIVERDDGKVDLYSGLSDCFEGKKTIDNPFKEYIK